MDIFNDFEKFALAIATAVYHFHRKASNISEYSFKDVCVALNTGSLTRSSSFTLSESDLEAAFENSTIRKSLKAIFPNQVIFQRRSIRVCTAIVHFHKIRFSSLKIGLYTVDSVFDGIINQLPRAAQDKNGDQKEEKRAV
jgi:hypothetical protein